nr:uncharacterized protein LOC117682052 [Crassostrea gigas]
MCKVLNIKKTRTRPYHPQCDGLVERFNKTLITMLRSLVDEHQSDWDELLPYVLIAYRSVEQESTGFSPNYLMLGREVRTPLDIAFEMASQIKDIPLQQWVWDLKEKMEMAHTFVRENWFGSMLRQKSFHDTKLSWNTFSPGDEVKTMPQMKTTPRKERKCPMCKFKSFDMDEITKNITECGLKQLNKRYRCDRQDCEFATNKMGNLTRHKKRHAELDQQVSPKAISTTTTDKQDQTTKSVLVVDEEKRKETDVDEEDSDNEWKEADPGNLHNIICDVSETESEKEVQHKEKDQEEVHIGRIYRKPTVPLPIFAPKRKEPFVSSSGVPARPEICRPSSLFSTSATQMEKKVRRIEWTITKWKEGDRAHGHDRRRVIQRENFCPE